MRTYSPSFSLANLASEKSPRFVVGIIYETDSLYFTSHTGIVGVPGVVTENVLTVREARSQKIFPDEGRSEIGVVNFDLLDLDAVITGLLRTKDLAGNGLRGRKVILYHGWAGAEFSTFQVFQTQVVQNAPYERGVYRFRCADITREQRKDIFDPKVTRLAASIDAAADTITVANTAAFQMIDHGTSFADAPSETVGYIKIDKEIIRYTGTSGGNTFTGCTRGVLNTRAVPHTVDLNVPADRRTEVREVIYLELPVPKMILAILTGQLHGQSATLPSHWHLGIDPAWVREADFTGIGVDLWNTSEDAASFVATFVELTKSDGKRFLEAELYRLLGCYPIVYADGTYGIKRMNRVLANASYVGVLDETNTSAWSELTLDMESVANDFRVDWNFVDGKPTRSTRLYDVQSISKHGAAKPISLQFKGLFGSRHTDSTVRTRLDSLRDRYAHPPALLGLKAMPHLNVLEVGDIIRVRNPHIRDYAGTGDSIDRSMEIQGTRIDLRTGEVNLDLFGSTGLASTSTADDDGTGAPDAVPLDDSFYDSEGTELGTEVDLTQVGDVWNVDAGTWPLPGHADMTNPAAIYYHLGDLTISADALIEISDNVQLRVMGHLTINGQIAGIAAGRAGVADTTGYGTSNTGTPGFGTTRGMDGIAVYLSIYGPTKISTIKSTTTVGTMQQVPAYDVVIVDGTPPILQGLPTDLRGTSGGPGGKLVVNIDKTVAAVGGDGGAGGAGLSIICRGLSFGGSGSINLSGGDSDTPPVSDDAFLYNLIPGAGAPGCPGALFILLDGQDLSLPDLSGGNFLAITGASGAPMANTLTAVSVKPASAWPTKPTDAVPGEGFLDSATTDEQDMSSAAFRIQYLSAIADPGQDAPAAVPAPANLTATGVPNGILLEWETPDFDQFDSIEIYAATSNDRTGAVKVREGKETSYVHPLAPATTRYYWIRARRGALVSEWEPTSSTGGATATST